MVCFTTSHFVVVLCVIIFGTALLSVMITWYIVKRQCSAEKIGAIENTDADIPVIIDRKYASGKHTSSFASHKRGH